MEKRLPSWKSGHAPFEKISLARTERQPRQTKRAGAHRTTFLADPHLNYCPTRFDALAIDDLPGRPPEIRLHKHAFGPQLRRSR